MIRRISSESPLYGLELIGVSAFRSSQVRESEVGQTIAFCRLSSSGALRMTGSKKHPKPLKTRELGKAKIERRLAASWRFRFSWNFAGRRPWVTGSKTHFKPLKQRQLGQAKLQR